MSELYLDSIFGYVYLENTMFFLTLLSYKNFVRT